MATTTTNFGWDIPQSTDLVKDGATAIAALGQDIDTALVDLKGGTTGQVLAKASGTDLDFSWVAQDDSNAIQNAIVDAKGDLIGATAADTPARLAVGTNGQVLTADSTAATGLAWATPASGSMTSIASGSLSGNALSLTSISGSYKDLVLILRDFNLSNVTGLAMRINSDTATSYSYTGTIANNATISAVGDNTSRVEVTFTDVKAGDNNNSLMVKINDYANTSSAKMFNTLTNFYSNGNVRYTAAFSGGWYATPAAITGVSIYLGNAAYSYSGGTYVLYGVN